MTRPRKIRLPNVYETRFTRCERTDDPRLLPVRGFTVHAWNRSDADVAAARALEAAGEDPKAWWYIGAERRRY